MSIVKMNKLSVIGLEDERNSVLDILHRSGCVQITDAFEPGEDTSIAKYEYDKRLDRIDEFIDDTKKARNAIFPFDTRKKNIFEPKTDISGFEFEKYINRETEIFSKIKSINELLDEKSRLSTEDNKLKNQKNSLEPWKDLDLSLDFSGTKYTVVFLGTVPNKVTIETLENDLKRKFDETILNRICFDNLQQYVLVITLKKNAEEVIKSIQRLGFIQVHFRGIHTTAKHELERIEREVSNIKVSKQKIDNKIKEFSESIKEIEVIYDYLLLEKQKILQISMLVKTQKAFLIEGWIPERKKDDLRNKLSAKTSVYTDFREPGKDEAFPIHLENGKFVRSFELITEMFSLPNHKEFDINPFMAPFYFVFFGLMLGDAGYGLILALITGIILLKFDLKGTFKKLMSMIFFGGVSTFIWGALFGSWFGDFFSQVSQGKFTIKPVWFNPLSDPIRLLIWSLIFGIIQLYVGMALSGYKMWKSGKKLDAIIDVGLRYIYYSGIIAILASVPGAEYAAIFGAVGLILTQGRHKKGLRKITGGIMSLYDFVGFMSDVLSYSRLLALGLATGVIASVINTMGTLLGMNVIGIIALVFIFIAGHIFNILINTLGAYVHSSRLQYVEFFSKFYEGGGKPYSPFKYETKYININDGGINDGVLIKR